MRQEITPLCPAIGSTVVYHDRASKTLLPMLVLKSARVTHPELGVRVVVRGSILAQGNWWRPIQECFGPGKALGEWRWVGEPF